MHTGGRLVAPLIIFAVLTGAYALQPEGEGKDARRPYVTRTTEKVKEFRSEDITPDSRKRLLDGYNDWARSPTIEVLDREVVESDSSLTIYAFYLDKG
jgi:hypothetical protein